MPTTPLLCLSSASIRVGRCCSAAVALAALILAGPSQAASPTTPAPASTKPGAKPPAKPATPATSRQQLQNQAKGLALAQQTVEQISAGQLDVAARVLTGTADCEFKQRVSVEAVPNRPGHFQVGYQARRFAMVPQETDTGAVRLEDRRAGIVWLQIPAKSMLMDSRRGQRLVDGCQHSEQRAAEKAAAEAGQSSAGSSLGIAAPGAVAPRQ